jgi:uncharacterized membrane protein YoaK (UPF0700 family)
MSGNTTQTGNLLAKGNLVSAILPVAAIASFFLGVFLGTVASQVKNYKMQWMPFVPVTVGLLLFLLLAHFLAIGSLVSIAIIATVMGYMNTAASQVGRQSINPDFVTGTLNNMARHLALSLFKRYPSDAQAIWDTHTRRYILLFLVWGSFIGGAVLNTLAFQYGANWSLLIPILVLIGLIINGFRNAKIEKQ